MKSMNVRALVIGVFVVTLGAGVTAGLLAAKLPGVKLGSPTAAATDGASLADQLQLTPEQSQQMRAIWEAVRKLSLDAYKGQTAAQNDRDDAIRMLIPADKLKQYEEITRNCSEACAALKGKRDAAFDKAVNDTKKLLNPTQVERYNDILNRRLQADPDSAPEPAHPDSNLPKQISAGPNETFFSRVDFVMKGAGNLLW